MPNSDTFDPSNPFGDAPPTGMAAEIDMLAADFALLGVSAHSAVPLWLGKPNRFTAVVMRSPKEVLDYIRAELEAQALARGEGRAKAPQADTGDDASVVSTSAPANETAERRRLHRERVQLAGDAWRKAILDRAAAMGQWNAYVEALRSEHQKLKLMKP